MPRTDAALDRQSRQVAAPMPPNAGRFVPKCEAVPRDCQHCRPLDGAQFRVPDPVSPTRRDSLATDNSHDVSNLAARVLGGAGMHHRHDAVLPAAATLLTAA